MTTEVEEPQMTWKELSKIVCGLVQEQGEWAGAPMPVENYELVVAPSYSYQALNGMKWANMEDRLGMTPVEPQLEFEETSKDATVTEVVETLVDIFQPQVVNSWWMPSRGGYVHVIRDRFGKSRAYIDWEFVARPAKTVEKAFAFFEAAEVLDGAAEMMAMDKLRSLIKPHLFNGYLIHGMILETSPRSGVTYIIRKGKPTIALRPGLDGNSRILCCLCMHPIGYYAGSMCGVMVPTDEVISHLILIRAKEEFFWRKANQHPSWAWEAGLN